MNRSIMKNLKLWKESPGRKPLILEGARQVGKTWIVREFGRKYFSDVAYINFDRERALSNHLARTLSPEALILAVEVLHGNRLKKAMSVNRNAHAPLTESAKFGF